MFRRFTQLLFWSLLALQTFALCECRLQAIFATEARATDTGASSVEYGRSLPSSDCSAPNARIACRTSLTTVAPLERDNQNLATPPLEIVIALLDFEADATLHASPRLDALSNGIFAPTRILPLLI